MIVDILVYPFLFQSSTYWLDGRVCCILADVQCGCWWLYTDSKVGGVVKNSISFHIPTHTAHPYLRAGLRWSGGRCSPPAGPCCFRGCVAHRATSHSGSVPEQCSTAPSARTLHTRGTWRQSAGWSKWWCPSPLPSKTQNRHLVGPMRCGCFALCRWTRVTDFPGSQWISFRGIPKTSFRNVFCVGGDGVVCIFWW